MSGTHVRRPACCRCTVLLEPPFLGVRRRRAQRACRRVGSPPVIAPDLDLRTVEFLGLEEVVTWGLPEPDTGRPADADRSVTGNEARCTGRPTGPAITSSLTRDGDLRAASGTSQKVSEMRRPRKLPRARHEIDGKRALPFAKVPTRVIRDASVSRDARILYALLATYADIDERVCFPSKRTLAEDLACTPRSIQNWTTELVQAGYLRVAERERKDGGRTSNLYILDDYDEVHR